MQQRNDETPRAAVLVRLYQQSDGVDHLGLLIMAMTDVTAGPVFMASASLGSALARAVRGLRAAAEGVMCVAWLVAMPERMLEGPVVRRGRRKM